MSSLRQAAVLLANLPAIDADSLFAKLNPEQARVVGEEVKRVAAADDELKSVVSSFARDNPVGASQVRQTLSEFLHDVDHEILMPAVIGEHPQAMALIFASLPCPHAVKALAALPKQLQTDVVRRIAAMGVPDHEILREVVIALRHRLSDRPRQKVENRAA